MQYNKWYTGYGSTVEQVDATIAKKRAFAIAQAMRERGAKRDPQERTMADDAWLNKRREDRKAAR